ncbi:hypothetical protein [Methanopyrus kandleri]|uniref:hypothetical protein n=1 Tax=Methanopyrus kandleri TaxID=2320 RepID=UPI0011E50AA4|nr:hypothetical protein [Methanopyrus kandleri]
MPERVPLSPTEEFYDRVKSYVERRMSDLGLEPPEDNESLLYDEKYGHFWTFNGFGRELWSDLSAVWILIVLPSNGLLSENIFELEEQPSTGKVLRDEVERVGRGLLERESKRHFSDYFLGELEVFKEASQHVKRFVLDEPNFEVAVNLWIAGAALASQDGTPRIAIQAISSIDTEVSEFPVGVPSYPLGYILQGCGITASVLCLTAHAMVNRGVEEDQLLEYLSDTPYGEKVRIICASWVEGTYKEVIKECLEGLKDGLNRLLRKGRGLNMRDLGIDDPEEFAHEVLRKLADVIANISAVFETVHREPERIVHTLLSVDEEIRLGDKIIPPEEYDPNGTNMYRLEKTFESIDAEKFVEDAMKTVGKLVGGSKGEDVAETATKLATEAVKQGLNIISESGGDRKGRSTLGELIESVVKEVMGDDRKRK